MNQKTKEILEKLELWYKAKEISEFRYSEELKKWIKSDLLIHIVSDKWDFQNPIASVKCHFDVNIWRKYQYAELKKFFNWEPHANIYDVDEAFEAGMSLKHFVDMCNFYQNNNK